MSSAQWIDYSISILGSIFAILLGFRVFGPEPGSNAKYDAWHNKWGKHLKWAGPVVILFSLIQIVFSMFVK